VKRCISKICKLPVSHPSSEDATPETKTKKTSSSTNNAKSVSAATIVTCLLLLFVQTLQADFINQPLDPGIYIEHFGDAHLSGGTFRLGIAFSIDKLLEEKQNINTSVHRYQKLCEEARAHSEEAHCMEFVQHLIDSRQEIFLHINDLLDFTHHRQKCGLLGELMTSVFGVNDVVYHDIDALQYNQDKLIDSTRHQSKLLVSAMTTMEKTEGKINQRLHQLESKLNHGLQVMSDMHSWFRAVDLNKINFQLLVNFQLAKNYLEEILLKYTKITKVVHKSGNLNEFLTPEEIEDTIDKTSRTLPTNLKILPRVIRRMELVSKNDTTNLYAYLPIIDTQQYQLIKATPVPKKENNTFFAIHISYQHLAFNYDSQTYFELTEQEVSEALKINSSTFICTPKSVRKVDTSPNSILDHIYNHTENLHCEYSRLAIPEVVWIPLLKPNTGCTLVQLNNASLSFAQARGTNFYYKIPELFI